MGGEKHDPQRPRLGPQARTEAELRRERQARALRENLRRRKERERTGEPSAPDGAAKHPR